VASHVEDTERSFAAIKVNKQNHHNKKKGQRNLSTIKYEKKQHQPLHTTDQKAQCTTGSGRKTQVRAMPIEQPL
jgi:hypothetical protein